MTKRPMVRCKELGMHCVTVRDGYYILGPVCVGVGLLILVRQHFIFDWLCHIVMIWDHLYEWLCLIAMFIIAPHIGHIIDCVCVCVSSSLSLQYLNDRVFNSSSTNIGPRTRTKMNKLQIWVWRTASQLQREPREAWWVVTKSTTNTNSNKTTSTTTTTLSQGAAASLRQRTKFKYFYCA